MKIIFVASLIFIQTIFSQTPVIGTSSSSSGSSATTYAALPDAATANLPSINGPLQAAINAITLQALGNSPTSLLLGSAVSGSTATPFTLSLGSSYSSTSGANPKIIMYPGYGLGISNQALDYIIPGGVSAAHKFWAAGSIVGTFNYQGLSVPGVINAGTLQQGGVAVALSNDTRITGAAQAANNLGDLSSAATAVTNLGLANAVTSIATPGVLFTTPVSISGHAATLALIPQSPNCIVAGPSSGSAATPTCRSLVALDLPNSGVHTGDLTGTFPTATVASIGGKAVSLANAGGLISSGDTGSVTNAMLAGSIAPSKITAAGSSGQVQFNSSGNPGADSNLFWDNTNKRLGIGTSSPVTPLHLYIGSNGYSATFGSGGTDNYVHVATTAGVAEFGIYQSSFYFNPGGLANGIRFFNQSNVVALQMAQTGSIGIGLGNTSPTGTLSIKDNTATTGATRVAIALGAADSATTATFTNAGTTKSAGYQSSDGSAGVTGSTCTAWKNGLCTSL